MKKNLIKFTKVAWLMIMAFALITTSCKKDDDDDDPETPPVIVLDGVYIKGAGTALAEFDSKGMMQITRNEVMNGAYNEGTIQEDDRPQLLEMFIAIKGGADGFNIVTVEGSTHTTLGPGADFAEVTELDNDEPKDGLWRGAAVATDAKFTVAEDGMYHVVFDTELMKVAIAKVNWGVIGGATPGGWGDNTPFTASAFDLNAMTFEIASVTMLENEWKFRYSNGWKIILDADFDLGNGNAGVKVNSNFGGAFDALVPGGDNIANATYANYKITMSWALGSPMTATYEWESDGEPLAEYPEEMFMIGDGVGDWDWANTDLPMVPVHSNPHVFWKVIWINEAGGFKFCEKKEWGLDFGKEGEATDGVYAKGADNVDVPGTAGYYMVVVNLLTETIEVNPALVYGIGDAFGSWDAAQEAALFTVDNDNEVIVSPAFVADAELRIHVAASTLTNADGNAVDWWQAEFTALNGVIEYRGTGDDQDRLPVTTGQVIKLNFKTGTAVVE